MATNLSLCSFCRFIPLDVNTLERLRLSPRAKSTLDNKEKPRPTPTRLDVGRNTLKLGARSTFALGKAERVFGSDCPFCKIVSMAVTELKRVVVWHDLRDDTPLKLIWTNKGPESKSVFRVNDHETVYICFVRQPTFSHNQLEWPSACYIHPVQPRIDLSQIREWIDHCQAFHGPGCNSPIGDTGHIRDFYRGLEVLRFVDVRRKCLVETYQNVRYVALSYVWGAVATVRLTTMNKAQMQTPYILSKLELPTTIWDAIDLVQGCGERYLWVDSLCIVQNDPMDLEGGTQVMDLVYERAVFTIVAACGSDAGYGLPGLHSGTRLPPPYMEVAPGVRLGVVSEVDALVEASCYSTRGWTFQEEMLSKRILYFVSDKMFFHCPSKTFSEECHEALRSVLTGSFLRMSEPVRDYKELVREYSKRALTTQGDALRAMSGITRRISESMQWHFVSGIPTVAIENVMMFRRRDFQSLSRRHDFPSYSWLGWNGAMDFMEGLYFLDKWIKWYVRDSSGIIHHVQEPLSEGRSKSGLDNVVSDDVVLPQKPNFGQVGLRLDQTLPSDNIQLDHKSTLPLLQFWSLAVFFELTDVDCVKGLAYILHPSGVPAGGIFLDGLDEYHVPKTGEFILLCKTIPSHKDGEKLMPGTRKEMYTVMLIEWNNHVAERRGIGLIGALDFKDSLAPGPIWKEFILG